jgi:hypothetical protein
MAIVAKESGNGNKYLHPEGQFAAYCIDVIDLGFVDTTFGGRQKKVHKIVVRFWAGQRTEEKEPLYAGDRFTLSLGDRATLRKFLEAWRGRAFTPEELKDGFDVEKLIGITAYLQVTHKESNGRVYANITSAMKCPAGIPMPEKLGAYVRVKDRDPKDQASDQAVRQHLDDDDDSLLF